MNFDGIVESLIQEALARGEFDNLPGQGKPLDLTDYFSTPENVRVVQAMLKNAGMVPVEIELLQEIASVKELLEAARDEAERSKLRKTLREKQLQFDLLLERHKR